MICLWKWVRNVIESAFAGILLIKNWKRITLMIQNIGKSNDAM